MCNLGYGISAVAISGKDAVNRAEETSPDLVLMDIGLEGDMDGIEAAEEIKRCFNIPVLYVTAYADDITLKRARITGPYGYLLKPFQERDLATSIEIALYKHNIERKLIEREQWLAVTLKSIGDAVITTDEKGAVTFMNHAAEKLTCWSQDHALGKDVTEVLQIKAKDAPFPREIPLTRILNERLVLGLTEDIILISKEGFEIPVMFSAAPIGNGPDQFIGGVIVVRDIKELKDLEEKIKESRNRFRTVIDNSPAIIYLKDLEGRYMLVNRRFEHYTGIPLKEGLGKTDYDFIPREFADAIRRNDQKVIDAKVSFSFEENVLENNELRTFLTYRSPLLHEDGTPYAICGVSTDITKQKRMEEKLRKHHLDLEMLVEERTRDLIIANENLSREIEERKRTEEKLKEYGFKLEEMVEERTFELKDAMQNLQNTQSQLLQSEKMASIGQLAAGVAHEINNPITSVMLNTQIFEKLWNGVAPIIEDYCRTNGDFRVGGMSYVQLQERLPLLLTDIKDGAIRVKRIVGDLKDFARQGPSDLSDRVDVNSTIKAAVGLASNLLKKSTNHFTAEYGSNIPRFKGNIQRIEQVIINLLVNACQSLRDKSRSIRVATSYDQEADSVTILIHDQGMGMSQEVVQRIRDPFFTTKRESGGTGLGLTISNKIVEDHRGTMEFDSKTSQGTTVTINLPVKALLEGKTEARL